MWCRDACGWKGLSQTGGDRGAEEGEGEACSVDEVDLSIEEEEFKEEHRERGRRRGGRGATGGVRCG